MDRDAGECHHRHFRIRVAGRLSEGLAERIGAGVEHHTTEGDTLLTGPLVDQSQLHGILDHLRLLGVEVVGFQTHEAEEES